MSEPTVSIVIGDYRPEDPATTDGVTFYADVTNTGAEPIHKTMVWLYYQYGEPRDDIDLFRQGRPDIDAESAVALGRCEFLDDCGQNAPLMVGETRRFVMPPRGIPAFRNLVELLPVDNFALYVELNGKRELACDSQMLHTFCQLLFELR